MKKILILFILLLIPLVIAQDPCTPSNCPSGYEDAKGVKCTWDGLKYDCVRTCIRPAGCGTYGGFSQCAIKETPVYDEDKGELFYTSSCSESSNYCYKYYAKANLKVDDWDPGWGLKAESVKVIAKTTWDEASQCSNMWIADAKTPIHILGRGSGGHFAGAKYYAYSGSSCSGSYDGIEGRLHIEMWVSKAPWQEVDIKSRSCKGSWDCEDGDEICSNTFYQTCENHEWVNHGRVAGECGVECVDDADCPYVCENYVCVDCREDADCPSGRICQDNQCIRDPCESVTCPDKCENSVRYSKGTKKRTNGDCECSYQEDNCPYGCSGNLCAGDPCIGVDCEDTCEKSIWKYDGECNPSTGRCVYASEDTCQFGCRGEPNPVLAIVVGGGMCRDTPCQDKPCDDYCSDTTLFINGNCNPSTGECRYLGKELYSEECGYVPWYKTMTFQISIGIGVLLFALFGYAYWRRRKK